MFSSIGGFIKGAFDGVVNWVVGDSGSVVQAVVGDAIKGAVYGAVIGAAQAAITGGDIKKGALRGAAIGGIATGITSSLKQMAGITDNVRVSSGQSDTDFPDPRGTLVSTAAGQEQVQPKGIAAPITEKYTNPVKPEKKWWEKLGLTEEGDRGRVIGGVVQGGAIAAGNYLTAKKQAEAEKERLEYKTQADKDKIAANMPGTNFERRTLRINKADWWDRRIA